MAKRKNKFYIGKGKKDISSWLFYGSNPPYFKNDEIFSSDGCKLIGRCENNSIDELEDNTIIELYIRKKIKIYKIKRYFEKLF